MIEEHPLEYQRKVGAVEVPEIDLEANIPWSTVVLSGIMGATIMGLIGWLLIVSFNI